VLARVWEKIHEVATATANEYGNVEWMTRLKVFDREAGPPGLV
jgi:hypothetical protein